MKVTWVNIIVATIYMSLVIISIVINNSHVYSIQLYQAKSYIDCNVDNDNNDSTCVAAYTIEKSFIISLGILFISILVFKFLYQIFVVILLGSRIPDFVSNTLLYISLFVIGGIQETKLVSILSFIVLISELLYIYHDKYIYHVYDNHPLILIIWIIQIITWCIMIISLIFYITNSAHMPIFITLYTVLGIFSMIVLKIIHYRFYYHNISSSSIERHETVIFNAQFRLIMTLHLIQIICLFSIMYFGTSSFNIRYV